MTRTISLIIGIAVVALVAVPTAFGEGRLAGSQEQNGVAHFYANERATLSQQPVQLDRRTDAFDRTAVLKVSPLVVSEHSAGFQRDVSTYVDANERTDVLSAPTAAPTSAPSSTGDGVDWPQIGIGFGIGIALAIVLGLSLKATRPRSLAH